MHHHAKFRAVGDFDLNFNTWFLGLTRVSLSPNGISIGSAAFLDSETHSTLTFLATRLHL